LSVASDHQIGSIAFPCISTGTFGYPKAQACEVAVKAVTSWLEKNDKPTSVVFGCFEAEDARLYRKRLGLKE
jgi:O-acetyl-ADP-ribose deacetylase (regulator of RNase III)